MDATQSGPTSLEALARRLDALERENAELRSKVATLEGSDTHGDGPSEARNLVPRRDKERASGFEGRVSRRSLLSRAGVAAAGLVVAGTLTQTDIREAKAAQIIGDSNQQFRGGVEGTNNGSFGYGVMGRASDGWGVDGQADRAGVRGSSSNGIGVDGSAPTGVRGFGTGQIGSGRTGVRGNGDIGVHGISSTTGWSSVYGEHTGSSGFGITGDGKGEAGAGVLGRNPDGTGVWGKSEKTGYGGVTAEHTGSSGYGVIGLGKGGTGAGVLGRNSGGYGGQFEGGKAQLKLKPGASMGKPTGSHSKGEIYMDSAGALFVCTRGGTPGRWKKVSTTAV